MKKQVFLVTLFAVLAVNRAEAANVAVIVTPPGILSVLILAFACAGIIVGYQVVTAVRGGLLSRSWQLITAGLGILALAQVAGLLDSVEIVTLPDWVIPGLWVAATGILFYGISEARRILR